MIQSCHFQREEGRNKLYGSMRMDVMKKKTVNDPTPVFPAGWIHQDKSTINRIMLRFRPIAPKPAIDGSASDSAKTTAKDAAAFLSKRRPKRKYVRVNRSNNNNNNNSSRISSTSSSSRRRKFKTPGKAAEEDNRKDLRFHVEDGGAVFDFQETTRGDTLFQGNIGSATKVMMSFGLPICRGKDNLGLNLGLGLGSGSGSGERPDRAVESWVVVNGVTKMTVVEVTGGGGGLLGSTDGEKMRNLETDTCPGLISDGMHRVRWVNMAYNKMVDPGREDDNGGGGGQPAEMVVRLVLKENIPVGWSVFACTVRVVYTWRKEKYAKTMPCDVWKMDFGGLAWRLDTKAALCLGR